MGTRLLSIVLCLVLLLPAGTAAEPPTAIAQSDAVSQIEATSSSVRGESDVVHTSTLQPSAEPGTAQPLSEEEEAELLARAEDPGPEVAGGALSNLHLTYAVIALAAIALVLVLK
ncbi:MAG: hypothetical protein KIT83_16335 [Bryobacterales bacterium]|nr:hypothetical protein [Bryobacterales bacterium]